MARDAIQNRDFSMQKASDIIHRLPIKQRRIGIKYMALGRQQFRGQQFAAANSKYPNVLEYLQALIAVELPQMDSSQVSINVVRGTTSDWHTDPLGQRSFVCTPVAQNPVMLQYRSLPSQSTVGHFVEVDSTRQHRVFSDQHRVSLAIYWQEQTPKVTQHWIDVAVRYGDIHAMQRHRLARHDDVHAIQQKVLDKLGIYLPDGWTIHTVAKTRHEVVMLAEQHQVQPHDQLAVTIVPGCTRRLPFPAFQGGGGGDEQVGKQLQKMKEADGRYTVAQRKAILAQSQHIKQLAAGNDLSRLKREMDKEAARLKLDPKGQVQSPQQQTAPQMQAAQHGQDQDGFKPAKSRKGKPRTTKPADGQKSKTDAIITLCPGQIASAGVALPVREKLMSHAPGVTVVTDLAQLKSLYEVFAKSKETQVAVAPCRFEWDHFEGEVDIWPLTIQTDTDGVLKELETQAAVYHLAGRSPQHTSSVPVVTLTEVVTEVVRVSTSKAAWQQGRWIYQDPSPKQLRTMFKDISDELVAAVLDAWKPQTAQESKSVLVRVHRKHVHSFLSVATKAGFACVPSRSFTEGSKVIWLREKTIADAVARAEQIAQDIAETDRWKRKSAILIKEAEGKTSFGVRVPEEQYATKSSKMDKTPGRCGWSEALAPAGQARICKMY
eukprot:3965735-Amphidinium_carterae.2